jgi:hypothetical protein
MTGARNVLRTVVRAALVLVLAVSSSFERALAAPEDEAGPVIGEGPGRIDLVLPELAGLRLEVTGGTMKRKWVLRTDRQKVWIRVHVYPATLLPSPDPADVIDYETVQLDLFDRALENEGVRRVEYVKGVKGGQAAGAIGVGIATHPSYGVGEFQVFGGVLRDAAFAVSVVRFGDADPAVRAALSRFLRSGIRAETTLPSPSWGDAQQVRTWIDRVIPVELGPKDFSVVLRTPHFILISDTKPTKGAAAVLEGTYEAVRKMVPFEEPAQRALIPGLLFETDAGYASFCDRTSGEPVPARRSSGHSRLECFAVSAEGDVERRLRHEAGHQIFRMRVRRFGGGSWLQEGLAEYLATTPERRRTFRREAASDELRPFEELVRTESLLTDANSDAAAGNAYLQAACMIEFLRDGAFHPDRFPTLIDEVGRIQGGHPDQVVEAIRRIYGVEPAEIGRAWEESRTR